MAYKIRFSDLREPMQRFIKKFPDDDRLSTLDNFAASSHVHSSSKLNTIDKEKEPNEYYTQLLCKALGWYANANLCPEKKGEYVFLFPGDTKETKYSHSYKQIFQRFEARFSQKNVPQKNAVEYTKFVTYTLYTWCKTYYLLPALKNAFNIPVFATPESVMHNIYQEFSSSYLTSSASKTIPTDRNIDNSHTLFGNLNLPTDKLISKTKKILKTWNITSQILNNLISDNNGDNEFKAEILNELKKIADAIMTEACKYPSYTYLKSRKHDDELQMLLSLTTTCTGNESGYSISIELPIAKIIEEIHRWYNQIPREYTLYSMLDIAGDFAEIAAISENHYIHFYNQLPSFFIAKEFHELHMSIFSDLASGHFKWIKNRRFAIRQYRLVFWGLGCAIKYNRNHIAPKDILADIYKNFRDDIEGQSDSDHTNWYFDNILCFTFALLYRLDDSISIPLIEMLCTNANDFSTQNRKHQEIAIYILTYLMYEKYDMPQYLRIKVFTSTYGLAIYRLQHDSWEHICGTSTFYEKYARSSFEEACKLTDSKYAKRQPHFFFLYGYLNKEINFKNISSTYTKSADDFLKCAAHLQSHSWFLGNMKHDEQLITPLRQLLDYVYKKLTAKPDEYILRYVYGSHYLCYAISNLYNNNAFNQRSSFYSKRKLLTIIIYTDFYNRYYNKVYNQTTHLESETNMFLINAPLRVICSKRFDYCSVALDKEKLNLYERWLRAEKGRYKFLMMRLLSYTNFFTELNAKEKNYILSGCKYELSETSFLPYDHMPDTPEECKLFLKDYRHLSNI